MFQGRLWLVDVWLSHNIDSVVQDRSNYSALASLALSHRYGIFGPTRIHKHVRARETSSFRLLQPLRLRGMWDMASAITVSILTVWTCYKEGRHQMVVVRIMQKASHTVTSSWSENPLLAIEINMWTGNGKDIHRNDTTDMTNRWLKNQWGR